MTGTTRTWVYVLASQPRGTLYVGVTSDLVRRVWEHREGVVPGFTARYHVHHLVHFQAFDDPALAIAQEKRLKRWRRHWKIALIEETNPRWEDLWPAIAGSRLG